LASIWSKSPYPLELPAPPDHEAGLLIRSARWAGPGPAAWGPVRSKARKQAARSVSESPRRASVPVRAPWRRRGP
jgi:hypothetical protein